MENNLELLHRVEQGDRTAEDALVAGNTGLVQSLAARFLYSGVEFEDLCQIGMVGLLKAVRNFDTGRNVMFSTYAVPVILGEIRRFLRDDGPVKVSRSIREDSNRIREQRQRLTRTLGRDPTLSELTEATGLSTEDLLLAMEAGSRPLSIDEPRGEEGDGTLGDLLPAAADPAGDVELLALKESLALLTSADRTLLVLRYFRGKTQQETAEVLGMSQVQVSRREKKLLEQLRTELSEPGTVPFSSPSERKRRRPKVG